MRWAAFWGALAAAAGAALAPLEPSVLEEGIALHTAERLAAGEHLYRDVVTPIGPLPHEFLALLFRLFGSSIALERGVAVGLQAIGAGLAYAIARRAGAGAWAHLAAASLAAAPVIALPLFSILHPTTLAFPIGLAAVYTGMRSPGSPRFALACGALLAALALCKASLGLVAFLAFALALPIRWDPGARRRALVALAGGAAAVTLLTLVLYASRGDLAVFASSQLELASGVAAAPSFASPLPALWPLGELAARDRANWVMLLPSLYYLRHGLAAELGAPIVATTQVLYALPFFAIAASVVQAARRRLGAPAALHAAFLAAMSANLFPRADWGHLVVALPAAFVQLALLFPGGRSRAGRVAATLACAGIVLATIVATSWLWQRSAPAELGPRVPLRAVSPALRGPALPRVVDYLRRHAKPGEAIFVARQEPLLYFATGTRNPTPFEGILQGHRELQQPRILEALAGLRFVVMSDIDQPTYTYYSDELPEVWAELERHFGIPGDFPIDAASWIHVAARDRDRGETAIDLLAHRDEARSWLRGAGEQRVMHRSDLPRLAARHLRRAYPIALGAFGGGVDLEVEVPENARLHAAVGMGTLVSTQSAYRHPPDTRARISIRAEGESEFRELLSQQIDAPAATWSDLGADLGRYAGRRATLRLEFTSERRLVRRRIAWFGSPRITRAPEAPR